MQRTLCFSALSNLIVLAFFLAGAGVAEAQLIQIGPGYVKALMVTDTANFRYPHYHSPEDTVEKINYVALASVVAGLQESLLGLVGRET